MTVFKRRSRVVSFRLSDEEYQAMLECCISHGDHSLSEFARSAACERSREWQDSFETLKRQIEELEYRLRKLTPRPSEPAKGNGGSRANALRGTSRSNSPRRSLGRREG